MPSESHRGLIQNNNDIDELIFTYYQQSQNSGETGK